MPTKLARTVASSVCGRVLHWSSVTTTAMAAPATINAPSNRPATRRAPESPTPSRGAIELDPEQGHPEDQGDHNREARVDERPWAEVGVHTHHDEKPSGEHGDDDADGGAEHPRREERPDDVDLRSQSFPLSIRRGARVRGLARREREGRRRRQQLDLRVELDEPRPTQLTAGGAKVREPAHRPPHKTYRNPLSMPRRHPAIRRHRR